MMLLDQLQIGGSYGFGATGRWNTENVIVRLLAVSSDTAGLAHLNAICVVVVCAAVVVVCSVVVVHSLEPTPRSPTSPVSGV